MKVRSLLAAGFAASAIAAPAAQAATGTTNVAGTVGTELSLAVSAPAGALSLTHASAASTTIPVTVVSTGASQTLSVADAPLAAFSSAGHTTGHMDKCTGTVAGGAISGLAPVLSGANLADELDNAFEVSANGTTWSALTQSRNLATPGLGVSNYNISVRQSLADTDSVSATDIYCITLGWTVS